MSNSILHTFILVSLLAACTNDKQSTNTSNKVITTVKSSKEKDQTDVALSFINGYVKNCNKMHQSLSAVDWAKSNSFATNHFKTELKKLEDNAFIEDPELGLNADPIFDAQDYPDKGFELESYDPQTNYIIVKGIDWPEFRLCMRIKKENDTWLVDACGMVNIPADKKIAR